jgi:hypothetical protein
MNYQRIHDAIVERAKTRTLVGYVERPHIIPRCMGGSNHKSNIVRLTAAEHFVVHQLLVKMHPGNKYLIAAVQMMTIGTQFVVRNNKLYSWVRAKLQGVDRRSEKNKTALALAAKNRVCSESTKAKMRAARVGMVFSEEHKAALRVARANSTYVRVASTETRQKISIAKKGKPLSESHKNALRVAKANSNYVATSIPCSEENKIKTGNFFRGKPKTDEQKAKMSLARKLYWANKKQAQVAYVS